MSTIRFDNAQGMLLRIAAQFFRDKWPIESVRAALTASDWDDALWKEMAELGWNGMAIPEEYGGAGLGMTELVTLVEPMGRTLFAAPFLSTQIVIQTLLQGGSAQQRAEWLPRLAEGSVGTLATTESEGNWDLTAISSTATANAGTVTLKGEKHFVLDAPAADLIVVSVRLDGDLALALVNRGDLPQAACIRQTVIDETRRSYRVVLDGVQIERDQMIVAEAAIAGLDAARETALLLLSSESVGGTQGVLNVILEYLKSRKQFGQLIGSYQALKHPTVDILCELERARSLVFHAATVFDCEGVDGADREIALRMAKAWSSDAFAFAGDRAIQFHGGFGFTYECDAQLYLRRALWNQYQLGDSQHHRKHLARLIL